MKDVTPDTAVTDHTPRVEALEPRRLMSGVTFDGGVLRLSGLANASNTAAVGVGGGRVHAILNGQRHSFGLATLKSIRITGGEAADRVRVDASVRVPVRVATYDGNDHVDGGSARDVIESGAGNDTVFGNGGNDAIHGGTGADHLYGNAGNDSINGGSGNDKLVGADGRDLFLKVERRDRVYGGAGIDAMTRAPVARSAPAPRAVGNSPAAATATLAGLSLINADTGLAVAGFEQLHGTVSLDLAKLPRHLSVAANLSGGSSAVRFDIDGNIGFRTERSAPYALGGDASGKFKPVKFSVGTHTLTASTIAGGSVMSSRSVKFVVTAPAKPSAPVTENPTAPATPTAPTTPTAPSSDAARPVAAITAISTTVPAGHAVHVDALASRLRGGSWNDGAYVWDFGDAAGADNAMRGFNAAHVYDRPGTYAVTLTVTNAAGRADSVTTRVTVTPANRKLIYVSGRGSDSNSGGSADAPIKSIAKALTLVDDNTEVLFRRGETFAMDASFRISHSNVVIGAYGSGARPKVIWNGSRNNQVMFFGDFGTQNITVQDLSIDTIFNKDTADAGTPMAFRMGGTNFTGRRCELLNLQYGFMLNARPTGVLIQGNTAPLETGLRKYFAWVEGTGITIVDNDAANSTREHIVRVNYAAKINVSDNRFANTSRRESGADYWDYRKTALNVQSGEFAYLFNNKLDASFQIGPLGKGHGGEITKSNRFKYAIGEGNEVINDFIQVNHGAEHVTLRDNVVRNNDGVAFNIDGYSSEYRRGVVDLNIDNNTAINTGASGKFLSVYGPVDGIRLTHNVYVAPNLHIGRDQAAVVKLEPSALGSFTEIDHNVWPTAASTSAYLGKAGVNYVGTGYVAKYFLTAEEWNALEAVGADTFRTLSLDQADGYVLNGVQVGARRAA